MIHPSGGKVVTNIEQYKDDDKIKPVYKQVIGKS
jgi:hypothetical protein